MLLDRVHEALQFEAQERERLADYQRVGELLESLTPREREVMDAVVDGSSNREISAQLGVSTKTVEAHRARMMEKLQADSISELVRMVVEHRNAG